MPSLTLSRGGRGASVEFSTAEIRLDGEGSLLNFDELEVIRAEFGAAGVTDLLVLCGGWSEEDADLRTLYEGITAAVRNEAGRNPGFSAHTYGILGVIWPAHRWRGAAPRLALENSTPEERVHRNIAALEMEVTSLRGKFRGRQADRHLLKVWQLISTIADSVQAQVSLVEHVRELVRGTQELDPSPAPDEYASRRFLTMHPIRLLESVSDSVPSSKEDSSAPPVDPANCDVFEGIRNLLRYAVAREMRTRSEAVGRNGLRESLLTLTRGLQQTRVHLVGHSFGARAVLTAVDAAADSGKLIHPKTLTILQGALPENAFAPASGDATAGIFHSILAEGKAGGPILVTHSLGDETAGVPYAISSNIAKHSQPGETGYPAPVGAMAQHGAVNAGAVEVSLSRRTMPRWKRGMVANLNARDIIYAHTDVCKPEIAEAILSAATTTT